MAKQQSSAQALADQMGWLVAVALWVYSHSYHAHCEAGARADSTGEVAQDPDTILA